MDADNEDCKKLKSQLLAIVGAMNAPRVLIRIAVEETEAFYLGDLGALKAAFPNADMKRAREYVPDSIIGTAELFGEIVGDDGLRKVMWAEEMGDRMTTTASRSRSPSFRALHSGIKQLVTKNKTKPKRKKHWKSVHSSLRKKK